MANEQQIYSDLKVVKERLYNPCDFELTNFQSNSEGVEYSACSFDLNGLKIEYRASKITPTKSGQFVTIWKRNKNGVTEALDFLDDVDFIVITSLFGDRIGQFIFPKRVLADKGIVTQNGKGGKRGIRVYPSWDLAPNKQAEKTQTWQAKYFVEIETNNTTAIHLTKELFKGN